MVVLFQPLGELDRPSAYLRTGILEPLGIEYVGAALRSEVGSEVFIAPSDWTAARFSAWCAEIRADVVGLSAYTYTMRLCLDIAHRVKALLPRAVVILGGYHPTADPAVSHDRNVDYVVRGPGEDALVSLVKMLAGGAPPEAGTVIEGERKPLNTLPWPLRDRVIMQKAKINAVMYPPPSGQNAVAQVTYSRGCPNACIFCSSPGMFGREVTWRDPCDVADELAMLSEDYGVDTVFFADLTFNADEARLVALCDTVATRGQTVDWFCMCSPFGLSESSLRSMAAAGCRKIGWGIETSSDENRSRLKPHCSGEFEHAAGILACADALGIINRVFMMIGLPWQGQEDIVNDYQRLCQLPIDELRIGFAVPFPGTALQRTWSRQAIPAQWADYTGDTPMYKCGRLSLAQLVRLRQEILKDFYGSHRYKKHVQSKVYRAPWLGGSFEEAAKFRDKQDDRKRPGASISLPMSSVLPKVASAVFRRRPTRLGKG
jgi:radical SAM superfamily enzyme YgiQ (UPF0313 family)